MRYFALRLGGAGLVYLISILVLMVLIYWGGSTWTKINGAQYSNLLTGSRAATATVDNAAGGQVCYSFRVEGRFYSKCDSPGVGYPTDYQPGAPILITYAVAQPSNSCPCHPADEMIRLGRYTFFFFFLAPILALIPTYMAVNWRRRSSRFASLPIRLKKLLDVPVLVAVGSGAAILWIAQNHGLITEIGGIIVIVLFGGAAAILTTPWRNDEENLYEKREPFKTPPLAMGYQVHLRQGAIWQGARGRLEIREEGLSLIEKQWGKSQRTWSILFGDILWIEKAGFFSIRLGLEGFAPLVRFEGNREKEEFLSDIQARGVKAGDHVTRVSLFKSS